MFGDDLFDRSARVVRVCCGPRCGAESEHRRIYSEVDLAVRESNNCRADDPLMTRAAMCQGYCGLGVTVVMPDGEKNKIRTASEVREIIVLTLGE